MLLPDLHAFFYAWPLNATPANNGWLVSLAGPTLRLLAGPAQLPENAPDLAGVIANVKASLDHCSHTLQRPQLGAKAVMGRALPQQFQQLLAPLDAELQRPARNRFGRQRLDAQTACRLTPAAHRHQRHPQDACDACRIDALPEHCQCVTSPLLQLRRTPFRPHRVLRIETPEDIARRHL